MPNKVESADAPSFPFFPQLQNIKQAHVRSVSTDEIEAGSSPVSTGRRGERATEPLENTVLESTKFYFLTDIKISKRRLVAVLKSIPYSLAMTSCTVATNTPNFDSWCYHQSIGFKGVRIVEE